MKVLIPAAFLVALLAASESSAQTATTPDGGPDPNAVRIRIGPLWLNPTVAMPAIGIDTNVFNDPESRQPKKDFTILLSPRSDVWLHMGRTWLFGLVSEDVVWYQKYTSERSVNGTYSIGWRAPLNRLLVTTSAGWVNTRQRPGFEIDERAQRREPTLSGSVEVRGFARTYIGVRGSWKRVKFDENGVFNNASLQEQLNRTERAAAVTVRYEITPLTSVTFSAGRAEERFTFATSRDSTTNDYNVSLNFDPAALIKGSATFGYTLYRPVSKDLPEYTGTTANVGLTYTLLGSTRVSANITRAIEFSYDINQPYYLLTGGSGSIAQQIFGPLDLVWRGGMQHLAYSNRDGVFIVAADRTDRVRSYGVGFGLHLGPDLRLGFNIDKERRTSPLPEREYEGMKYGSSVTYGL